MARMENALLKLLDLSATTANPTAQTVDITAGPSRHGAEVEGARTLEPFRGTNGSRQGTPEPEQGAQGSGDRGIGDENTEEVGHEDQGSNAAEAEEEDDDDEESILLSDPPCPSCEETLSDVNKQSTDPETEYYDVAKERPLSILKCDCERWCDDQEYAPSVWDGSEGDTAEWKVGDLEFIAFGEPNAFLRRIPRAAARWNKVKVYLEPSRPNSF